MNEYNDPHAAFNDIMREGFALNPQVTPAQTPAGPYGPHAAVKTGVTPRGKAALVIAATLVAGGSLLGYQHYSAAQAANQIRAQELSIEQQKIDLERIKALGKVNETAQKTQNVADKARQVKVDSCVAENKSLVGKQLGATYRSVLDDCQAQYPDSGVNTADMQTAASANDSGSGGGAANGLSIVAGIALVGGLVTVARKTTRSNKTQQA